MFESLDVCWKHVLGTCWKVRVSYLWRSVCFVLNVCLLTLFSEKWTFGKLVEQFRKGLIPLRRAPINNNRRMLLNIRLRQLTNGTIVKKNKHAMSTTKYNKCNWTFCILLENNSCFKICFVFVHKKSLHFRCGWRLLLIANKSFE